MTDSLAHLHPTVRQYIESQAIADLYDEDFSENKLFRYDCDFIHDQLPTPCRLLDLGCGTGRHLSYFGAHGYSVVGIDLSAPMLARAYDNLCLNGNSNHLIQADFHSLPIRKEISFDGILLMFSALGMIRTEALRFQFISSLRRHLTDKGRLIAHVHNRHFRMSFIKSLAKQIAAYAQFLETGDQLMRNYRGLQDLYLHLFTQDELTALFRRAGYRIETLMPLNTERDGPYEGTNADGEANGFLISVCRDDT